MNILPINRKSFEQRLSILLTLILVPLLALQIDWKNIGTLLKNVTNPISYQFIQVDQLHDHPSDRLYCNGTLSLYNIIQKISQEKLTDNELTLFAQDLLQIRINYWNKKLKNSNSWNRKEIPLYIQLKPNIKPDEMLSHCSLIEKTAANRGASGFTKHAYGEPATITIRQDFCHKPVTFLVTLSHELTHVEQTANADALGKHKNALVPAMEEFPFLTNKIAYDYNSLNSADKDAITMAAEGEAEADLHGILFFPNPLLVLKGYATALEKIAENKVHLEQGYLPNKKFYKHCWERAEKYYAKYPERLAQDHALTERIISLIEIKEKS